MGQREFFLAQLIKLSTEETIYSSLLDLERAFKSRWESGKEGVVEVEGVEVDNVEVEGVEVENIEVEDIEVEEEKVIRVR
jgi:hypothetical protein